MKTNTQYLQQLNLSCLYPPYLSHFHCGCLCMFLYVAAWGSINYSWTFNPDASLNKLMSLRAVLISASQSHIVGPV